MVLKKIQINFMVSQRFFDIIGQNTTVKNVEDLGNGSTVITIDATSEASVNNLKNTLLSALIEIL